MIIRNKTASRSMIFIAIFSTNKADRGVQAECPAYNRIQADCMPDIIIFHTQHPSDQDRILLIFLNQLLLHIDDGLIFGRHNMLIVAVWLHQPGRLIVG